MAGYDEPITGNQTYKLPRACKVYAVSKKKKKFWYKCCECNETLHVYECVLESTTKKKTLTIASCEKQ